MAAEFVRVVKCLDHGKTQMLKDAQDYTARNLQQTSERDKNKIWKLHNNYQKEKKEKILAFRKSPHQFHFSSNAQ